MVAACAFIVAAIGALCFIITLSGWWTYAGCVGLFVAIVLALGIGVAEWNERKYRWDLTNGKDDKE